MDSKGLAKMNARAEVVKAMAHPTRLIVLEALGKGEMCVGDLQGLVDCDLSTMSKHLLVLRNAHIVECERRGTQVFYSLAQRCVMNLFPCVDKLLDHQARRHAEVCE